MTVASLNWSTFGAGAQRSGSHGADVRFGIIILVTVGRGDFLVLTNIGSFCDETVNSFSDEYDCCV